MGSGVSKSDQAKANRELESQLKSLQSEVTRLKISSTSILKDNDFGGCNCGFLLICVFCSFVFNLCSVRFDFSFWDMQCCQMPIDGSAPKLSEIKAPPRPPGYMGAISEDGSPNPATNDADDQDLLGDAMDEVTFLDARLNFDRRVILISTRT